MVWTVRQCDDSESESCSVTTALLLLFQTSPPPALKCPSGSHYNPCGSACPQPSCQDPAGPGGSCNQPCVEGCVCNPGLILSGDKCVPLSECGCTDGDGNYRPVSVLRQNSLNCLLKKKILWTRTKRFFVCAICVSLCVYVGGRCLVHWEGLLTPL